MDGLDDNTTLRFEEPSGDGTAAESLDQGAEGATETPTPPDPEVPCEFTCGGDNPFIDLRTKYCSRCKQHKLRIEFFKSKRGALGLSGYCKTCCKAYKAERYADVQNVYDRNKRDRLKSEFLAAYGNKCECCGETEPDFLTVDHKNNDGEEHRKKIAPTKKRGGNSSEVFRVLRKEGWPNYVRILCFNCNFGRRARPGFECPHKRRER